ncbi:hypothetical protein C8F01DRAFT_1058288 [Mycena amicta]|nr:hypothetical protein C8F01DRAFT_1058288 [Mycena amicta]
MSFYKSFAVVGAGTVGFAIVAGLAAKNLPVVVLARPGSKSTNNLPAGVKLATVNTSDAAAIAAVLKEHKVDVVLSTVTTTAVSAQKPMIDAAKTAGIKLFVPSEYGMPSEGVETPSFLADKNQIAEYLKNIGVPSLKIYTGTFIEFIPWAFGYTENKKINVVGKGEAPISFTSVSDIAGFVVHVLTTLPSVELENKTLRLEGERFKANELGTLFNTTVEHVSRIPGELGDLMTIVLTVADSGAGSTGWNSVTKCEGTGDAAAGSANKLWAGHHWKTIKEVHNL